MYTNIQEQLGNRIKKLRKIKGLSQESFAEQIDIAVNTLSSIETGKAFMTSQTLGKILEVLGVTASDLFTFVDEQDIKYQYEYIVNKLNLIKEDAERLNIIFNIVKNIF